MTETDPALLTRRQWLGKAPIAFIAAGLTGEEALAANTRETDEVASSLGARVYNIRTFGAKGDGSTLDTAAFQAAIDACTRDGGGTVLVPAGTFHIGTVELKSNVTLHIAASGKLLGSADGKQYHAVDAIPLHGDTTLDDGNWALLFAVNAKNVTIEGPGTIDGQGAQFHSAVRGTPPPSGIGGNKRPYHVLVLSLRDLHRSQYLPARLRLSQHAHHREHSAFTWTRSTSTIASTATTTDSISSAPSTSPSRNCIVKSQDDACAMFGAASTSPSPTPHFSTRWSVFRFGGGQPDNIAVSNCLLHEVYGCPIKFQVNSGSRHENISFSNLVLDNVTGPIHVAAGPTPPGDTLSPAAPAEQPAIVRNISFSNIQGTVTTSPAQLTEASVTSDYRPGERHSCITFNCVGGAVMENISLENVHLTFGGGGTAEDAARRDLPQIAGEYFMMGPMPAYGLYARNVHGITMQNMRFQVSTPDLRPALIFDHVEDAAINGFSVQANPQAESVVRFIDSRQTLFTAVRVLGQVRYFCSLRVQKMKPSSSMAATCRRPPLPSHTRMVPGKTP